MRYLRIAVGLVLIGWAPAMVLGMMAWREPYEFGLAIAVVVSMLAGAWLIPVE